MPVRLIDAAMSLLSVPAPTLDGLVALGARPATSPKEGADADFTSAIKPIERAGGVTVGNSEKVRMILSVVKNSTTRLGADYGHYQVRLIIETLTGNLLITGEQGC
jgi:hypothetical protein